MRTRRTATLVATASPPVLSSTPCPRTACPRSSPTSSPRYSRTPATTTLRTGRSSSAVPTSTAPDVFKKKRFIIPAILVALVLMISVASCGGNKNIKTVAAPTTSPSVTVSPSPPPRSSPSTVSPSPAAAATAPAPAPVLAAPAIPVPAPAVAPTSSVSTFASCVALNAVYPHGVGRAGATDVVKGSTKPVTNFTVNTDVYNANIQHDGDGDGVACEQH